MHIVGEHYMSSVKPFHVSVYSDIELIDILIGHLVSMTDFDDDTASLFMKSISTIIDIVPKSETSDLNHERARELVYKNKLNDILTPTNGTYSVNITLAAAFIKINNLGTPQDIHNFVKAEGFSITDNSTIH